MRFSTTTKVVLWLAAVVNPRHDPGLESWSAEPLVTTYPCQVAETVQEIKQKDTISHLGADAFRLLFGD